MNIILLLLATVFNGFLQIVKSAVSKIESFVSRKQQHLIITDQETAKIVLSDLKTYSRTKPNQAIGHLFSLSNVFTIDDESYRKDIRRTLSKSYLRVDRQTFEEIYHVAKQICKKVYLQKAGERKLKLLNLSNFCQIVTIGTFAQSFLGLEGFEEIGTECGILINKLWSSKTTPKDTKCDEMRTELMLLVQNQSESHHPLAVWSYLVERTKDAGGQYAENLLNIIIPGYETMWRVVFYFMLEMCRQPDLYKSLIKELQIDLDIKCNENIDLSAASSSKGLLRKSIHETLRLYPPTKNIYRIANMDTKLCKAGTMIQVDVQTINEDTNNWKRPEDESLEYAFQPELHSQDKNEKDFLSFGAGTTSCVAAKEYAPNFLSALLAAVLSTFEINGVALQLQESLPNPAYKLLNNRNAYANINILTNLIND